MAGAVTPDEQCAAAALEPKPTLTPPASEGQEKGDDSSSELSELDPDFEDELEQEEIVPDHYYEGGKIPVFKPTMAQFRDFNAFIHKIDKYGMKSGIVKVIPPKEWRDSLPQLDEAVKTIKVKNPITQEFAGTHGTYRQANIEKQRSYNLPQWKAVTEESNHQPPARRGERRRNQDQPARGARVRDRTRASTGPSSAQVDEKKRGPGRPSKRHASSVSKREEPLESVEQEDDLKKPVPPTPVSPHNEGDIAMTEPEDSPIKKEPKEESVDADEVVDKPKGRQPRSVTSRRKNNRREVVDVVDEEAFREFDYRIYDQDDYTPQRCEELERAYWKGITFNSPMYGADMPGSLFDESTTSWNVAKLPNLLDVLGQKLPGVNTAYLYLGMWKATFAWHLEDVDLYSINYLHFGAPKQWYSISQADARRFEAAMKSIWTNDWKNCDQFLRHKTYLISPQLLQSQYNIKVNRLVHHEGEFVITFPYGYHSGFNLGYNCAESVNFATEDWLNYGRIAKKCNCEADSVWVDVEDIERKLRGEPTPEYYETEEEIDEDEEEAIADLPTPPSSVTGKTKKPSKKRKREAGEDKEKPKTKKIKIRIKAPAKSKEPCVLCPNDIPSEKLLPTDNGKMAHRLCAIYTPETYISEETGSEMICNVSNIDKARLDLKCNYCRSKRGACFQCSAKKCTRAYHATCAAAAGVLVDRGLIPVFAEDGTEYTDEGIHFRCRFHRPKRGKNVDILELESSKLIMEHAKTLQPKDTIQMQYLQGEIFAGVVVENRVSEQMVLIDLLPSGGRIEVEHKWVLAFDPADSQLPVPSPNAKPLPTNRADKPATSTRQSDIPEADEPFGDETSPFKWSEFHQAHPERNPAQVKIDFSKKDQLWYYLGKTSTEARAQFTEDVEKQRHNTAGNFLQTVAPPKPPPAPRPVKKPSYPAAYPNAPNFQTGGVPIGGYYQQPQYLPYPQWYQPQWQQGQQKQEKPYQYKPRPDKPGAGGQQTSQVQQNTSGPPGQHSYSASYPTSQMHNGFRPAGSPVMGGAYQSPNPLSKTWTPSPSLSQSYTQNHHSQQNAQTAQPPNPDPGSKQVQQSSEARQIQQIYSNGQRLQQAPNANMSPPSYPYSSSPQPSSKISPQASPHNPPAAKYPYLNNVAKSQEQYRSPYSPAGGVMGWWMANPLQPHQQRPYPGPSPPQTQQAMQHQMGQRPQHASPPTIPASHNQANHQSAPQITPQAAQTQSTENDSRVKQLPNATPASLAQTSAQLLSGYDKFFADLKSAARLMPNKSLNSQPQSEPQSQTPEAPGQQSEQNVQLQNLQAPST